MQVLFLLATIRAVSKIDIFLLQIKKWVKNNWYAKGVNDVNYTLWLDSSSTLGTRVCMPALFVSLLGLHLWSFYGTLSNMKTNVIIGTWHRNESIHA